MRIAIGSDHAGFELKQHLVAQLANAGHTVVDCGPDSSERVDYPDYGFAVANKVAEGDADRGVVICGSGIGISIAANRVEGARAALCMTPEMAELARQHNDANVLALGARLITQEQADAMLEVFLQTGFEGGRHAGRVEKLG